MRRLTRPGGRASAVVAVAAVATAGSALLSVGLTGGEHRAAATGSADPVAAATPALPAEEAPPTLPPEGVALPTPSSDVHVVIDGLDMDLPVLPLTARGGAINPPTLTAAYWIQPYGEPVGSAEEADNTLYLAAHSTGTGDYGFDPLMESGGGGTLEAGDVVEVSTPTGQVSYTVERTERYAKGELPAATEVWENSPGRLVLITCFQRGGGQASTENLVVFAEA